MRQKKQPKKSTASVQAFRERIADDGGRRVDVYLTAHADAALQRWKAHTGAPSDTQAVKLAILSAVTQARA